MIFRGTFNNIYKPERKSIHRKKGGLLQFFGQEGTVKGIKAVKIVMDKKSCKSLYFYQKN